MTHDEREWMLAAYALAQQAEAHDEVPVGAVIVRDNKIIGTGRNRSIASSDPSAHAEIVALREAGRTAGNYRLPGAVMYVTLEPCPMCAGAMIQARLAGLVYAVDDPRSGACGSVLNVPQVSALNHRVSVKKGVLEDECRLLIQRFFRAKREQGGAVSDSPS